MRIEIIGTGLLLACGSQTERPDTAPPDAGAPRGSPTVESRPVCLVDSTGIGGVRVGMTLGEARQALPQARLERTEDGAGVQWVDVLIDTTALMSLLANEDEPAIDWSKRVEVIQTFHPSCATASGIHPGLRVTDVERVLGEVTRIVESELESRQFVTFRDQPSWMTLRLDYTGIFPDGTRETTRYEPDARIFAIAVESALSP